MEKLNGDDRPTKETKGHPASKALRAAGTTHDAMADLHPLRRTIARTRAGASLAVATVARIRGAAWRRATRANFTDVLPASTTKIG